MIAKMYEVIFEVRTYSDIWSTQTTFVIANDKSRAKLKFMKFIPTIMESPYVMDIRNIRVGSVYSVIK